MPGTIAHDTNNPSYNSKERTRIIRDIAHWKQEYELDNRFEQSEFEQFVELLHSKDDAALRDLWYRTVGEWLLHRESLPWPARVENEAYLDIQFGKLLAGLETDYGFVVSISLPTPT